MSDDGVSRETDQASQAPDAVPEHLAGADDVADSTEPDAPPETAVELAGDRLPGLVAYAKLLADDGVRRGLIGPREVGRLWERHLLNCAVIEAGVPEGARVCDVGSGAGLPGVVLALLRPDLEVTLLEPLLRRTRFLDELLERLTLVDRVRVERNRAEECGATFDAVVARAVAPLDRLARVTLPLCVDGGVVLAMKGRNATAELETAEPTLRRCNAASWSVERYGAGVVDPPTTVIRVVAGADRWGRRSGSGSRRRR